MGFLDTLRQHVQPMRHPPESELVRSLWEQRDLDGIRARLEAPATATRVRAFEAAAGVAEPPVVDLATDVLARRLADGDDEDTIEAITLLRGGAQSPTLISAVEFFGALSEERAFGLKTVTSKAVVNADVIKPLLLNEVHDPEPIFVVPWCATAALVELGERSEDVARLLVEAAEHVMTWLVTNDACSRINGYMLASVVRDETLALLSSFTGIPAAREAIVEIMHGERLLGCLSGTDVPDFESTIEFAQQALAAFDNPRA